MDVDQQTYKPGVVTRHLLLQGDQSTNPDLARSLHLLPHNFSMGESKGVTGVQNVASPEEQGSSRSTPINTAVHKEWQQYKFNPPPKGSFSHTLYPIHTSESREDVSQPGMTLHAQGTRPGHELPVGLIRGYPNSIHSSNLTTALGSRNPANSQPASGVASYRKSSNSLPETKDLRIPDWLVETLSNPSPQTLLVPTHSTTPLPPQVNYDASSGESPLFSFPVSTPSPANTFGKPQQNAHLSNAELDSKLQYLEKDEDIVFAFAPPTDTPYSGSLISSMQRSQRRYITSTPPGIIGLVHNSKSVSETKADDVVIQAPTMENLELSLVTSSIPSIAPLNDFADKPLSVSSSFTTSSPATLFVPIEGDYGFKKLDPGGGLDISKAEQEPTMPTHFLTPKDPFGATWASLQSSKPTISATTKKPYSQRRFFFSKPDSSTFTAQPTLNPLLDQLTTNAISSLNLSTSETSRVPKHAWMPSFPSAKVPNHRNALLPQRSQLRNGFLGAENPLITASAIEEATSAANDHSTSRPYCQTLQDIDASVHVRFRTPSPSPSGSLFSGSAKDIPKEYDHDLQYNHVSANQMQLHPLDETHLPVGHLPRSDEARPGVDTIAEKNGLLANSESYDGQPEYHSTQLIKDIGFSIHRVAHQTSVFTAEAEEGNGFDNLVQGDTSEGMEIDSTTQGEEEAYHATVLSRQ